MKCIDVVRFEYVGEEVWNCVEFFFVCGCQCLYDGLEVVVVVVIDDGRKYFDDDYLDDEVEEEDEFLSEWGICFQGVFDSQVGDYGKQQMVQVVEDVVD